MTSRLSETSPQADAALRALDAVARHQFTWINESFVHVLTLREWGEERLADRIDDEYRREIPRAFRTIELIVELGGRVDLERDARPYVEDLPQAGRSVAGMRERERESMQGFEARLREAREVVARSGPPAAAALLEEAQASRTAYVAWLSDADNSRVEDDQSELAARTLEPVTDGAAPVWHALDRLYAHLNAAIEETCVQMLVLRCANRATDAAQAWRDSWAYMLFASDLVRLFARRGWALELTAPEIREEVEAPSGDAPDEVAKRRQQTLLQAANAIAATLEEAEDREAVAIPEAVRAYAGARIAGERGQPPTPAPNFEGMLAAYAYPPG